MINSPMPPKPCLCCMRPPGLSEPLVKKRKKSRRREKTRESRPSSTTFPKLPNQTLPASYYQSQRPGLIPIPSLDKKCVGISKNLQPRPITARESSRTLAEKNPNTTERRGPGGTWGREGGREGGSIDKGIEPYTRFWAPHVHGQGGAE